MNGSGTLTHPSGSIYTGLFRDNMYQGQGIYKFPDGTEYNGTFNNNRCYAMNEMCLWSQIYVLKNIIQPSMFKSNTK